MTGSTNDDVWGAARTDGRQRRRWRRATITVASAAALMVAAPLVATAWRAAGIAAAPLVAAIGLAAIAAVALGLGLGWRDADEVVRARALRVFATVGAMTIVGNPIAEMLGAAFHRPAPVEGLWWLSIAVDAAVFVVQRWRDRATG